LRTEVCYPLYGHELDEQTTPLEAGVGFFVALDKGPFIGSEKLIDQKNSGVQKKCVAFKMTGSSPPPRPDYAIFSAGPDGQKIGKVVSGTQSPSLNVGIGMGYIPAEKAQNGQAIEIEVRGRRFPAVICPKPIYKKTT
jgi:aminomethyltransferase